MLPVFNFKILATAYFWLGFVLWTTSSQLSIWRSTFDANNWFGAHPLPTKIALSVATILLYVAYQLFSLHEISSKRLSSDLARLLSSADLLKILSSNLRIRTNIFVPEGREHFQIKYAHGMDGQDDRNLTIPRNKGCTGEAWRTGNQQFQRKEKFFGNSEFCLPDGLRQKAPPDLEWICSTPLRKNGSIIAVLNIDGNVAASEPHETAIKDHANRMASVIESLYSRMGS